MQLRSFARLALFSFAHLWFLEAVCAQEAAESDALRRGLTWQHNGQVFSILSRGAQYRPSGRRQTGSPRSTDPVLVVSSSNDTGADAASSPRVPAASGSRQLRAMTRQQARAAGGESAPVNREDMMVGDDPYNPYKRHGYDPYYNYFDTYQRPRPRVRPGYGTQYHQNGENNMKHLLKLLQIPGDEGFIASLLQLSSKLKGRQMFLLSIGTTREV